VETKSARRRAINARPPARSLARSGETSPGCVAVVIHHPWASLPASVSRLTDLSARRTDDFADQLAAHRRRRRLVGSALAVAVNDNSNILFLFTNLCKVF